MLWHILRLLLLLSLATVLAGLLLAPAPVQANALNNVDVALRIPFRT